MRVGKKCTKDNICLVLYGVNNDVVVLESITVCMLKIYNNKCMREFQIFLLCFARYSSWFPHTSLAKFIQREVWK